MYREPINYDHYCGFTIVCFVDLTLSDMCKISVVGGLRGLLEEVLLLTETLVSSVGSSFDIRSQNNIDSSKISISQWFTSPYLYSTAKHKCRRPVGVETGTRRPLMSGRGSSSRGFDDPSFVTGSAANVECPLRLYVYSGFRKM